MKKVWEKRNGFAGDINLVLISLLQSFNIDASPLLVAERDYGKVDPKLPFVDRFNKTVAYVTADGRTFILDATQKFCPAGLTPYPLLNTYALIINKKTTGLIPVKTGNEVFSSTAVINATLDKTGLLTGKSVIKTDEYAKQLQSEQISKNEKSLLRNMKKTTRAYLLTVFLVKT